MQEIPTPNTPSKTFGPYLSLKQFKMIMKNILLLTNTQIFQPSTDSEHLGARVEVSVQITYYEFQVPGALLVLPAACRELFWSAAVLSALGSTLAVIIGLPLNATIIVSGKL